jgi:hypothetical protein
MRASARTDNAFESGRVGLPCAKCRHRSTECLTPRAESNGSPVLSGQAGARVRQQFSPIDKVQRAFLLDGADEFALLRGEKGHSLLKCDVRDTFAFPPIAAA